MSYKRPKGSNSAKLSKKEKRQAVCNTYDKMGLRYEKKSFGVGTGAIIDDSRNRAVQIVHVGKHYVNVDTFLQLNLPHSDREELSTRLMADNQTILFGKMYVDKDGDAHFTTTVYLKKGCDLSYDELKFHIGMGFSMARRMCSDYGLSTNDAEPSGLKGMFSGESDMDVMFG